jgi:hypothetical protein
LKHDGTDWSEDYRDGSLPSIGWPAGCRQHSRQNIISEYIVMNERSKRMQCGEEDDCPGHDLMHVGDCVAQRGIDIDQPR